jgi:CheY-like chemotaxis protein
MRQSAAVLCHDKSSLGTLRSAVERMGGNLVNCSTQQAALEMVLSGDCSTLIVDFDLPGAGEVIRMAALLPPEQKPALLALSTRVWPGTGQVFQSGASRILYKPLDKEQVKEAVAAGNKKSTKAARKAARFEMKTLVYLEIEGETLPGIGIDISQHGLAVQAAAPVPMSSNLAFRCVLPGTEFTLQGHAEVIWASEHGRAGLFFTRIAPAARKHLKHWLGKRGAHNKANNHDAVRALLPPADAVARLSVSE